jgi:hypothetical protein
MTAKEMFKKRYRGPIKESVLNMMTEMDAKKIDIAEKLEKLREKLVSEGAMEQLESMAQSPTNRRYEKRISAKTVSEIIDVPINELLLYFINEVKTKNTRSLVEYRMAEVYFYEGGMK